MAATGTGPGSRSITRHHPPEPTARRRDGKMTHEARRPFDALVPPSIFLLGFLYFYFFRRLGWFMQDEGVLYYNYLRVYEGQLPFRDFFTGYPPMMHYLHAWVFSRFGASTDVIRTLMAVVNAVTAAGLYVVARRLASRWFAAIPSLLFLVMQPGEITDMDFHNSPYPGWYALTFAVLGTWTLLRSLDAMSEQGRSAWLIATGLLGGLILLSKQNMGVFFLWGVTGFLASWPGPATPDDAPEPLPARLLRRTYLALIPATSLFLVHNYLGPVILALFVIPLAVLSALGARTRFNPRSTWRLVSRFLCVAAGFGVAFAPWLIYFSSKIGAISYLRALFLVGSDLDRNLYIPFPLPSVPTLVILIPVTLLLLIGLASAGESDPPGRNARESSRPRARLQAALLSLVFLIGAIASQANAIGDLTNRKYGLGQIYIATSVTLDNLFAYLTFPLLTAALVTAVRRKQGVTTEIDPSPDYFLCVLWIGVCLFLAYYPRMDSAHLVSSAPLLYIVSAALLSRLTERLTRTPGRENSRVARLSLNVAFALLVAFIVALKSAPKVYSRVMLSSTSKGLRIVSTPNEWLNFDRASVYFPIYLKEQRAPARDFRKLIDYLRNTTREDEPIFAFPAFPMVYFVSQRDNPTRQDYFFGTNVSFHEQLELIRTLERNKVRTVVLANNPSDYFVRKNRDFTGSISEYLRVRYYLKKRFGPYDVLLRYGPERSQHPARR